MSFKKSTVITGKFKNIITDGINFVDAETSELINLSSIIYDVYGNDPVEISIKKSTDEVIDLEGGDI